MKKKGKSVRKREIVKDVQRLQGNKKKKKKEREINEKSEIKRRKGRKCNLKKKYFNIYDFL